MTPSRWTVLLCVVVGIPLIVLGIALQCSAQAPPPGIKTDRGIYPEPPLPPLPKAGGTITDPTFGTTIMRVTDEADGKDNMNAYSYYKAFNRTSTRFLVNSAGRGMLYQFDPQAFAILGKENLFAKNTPAGAEPWWEDAHWSDQDPDVLFCHQGLNLWTYNVVTKSYTLIRDFTADFPPGHIRQVSKSLDDDVFAFNLQDPKWNVYGFGVYRRSDDKVLMFKDMKGNLDEVQVDKTGHWLVVKTDKQGHGVVQNLMVDLDTLKTEELIDDAPDFAPGHSDNGHGFIIGADNWMNRLTYRRYATPHQFYSVLDLFNDWSQDAHISLIADDERWVLLSFYVANKLPNSGVFKNEIVQVSTDGKQRLRRLCHHRSVMKSYWDSPRACISRDGRFATFTSTWGDTGRRDVFILKVPPMEGG
jgi:hypothetical protein